MAFANPVTYYVKSTIQAADSYFLFLFFNVGSSELRDIIKQLDNLINCLCMYIRNSLQTIGFTTSNLFTYFPQ